MAVVRMSVAMGASGPQRRMEERAKRGRRNGVQKGKEKG
jgi:hypothetical protein